MDEALVKDNPPVKDDMIICPACGTELAIGTENCTSCGAPVGAVTGSEAAGVAIDNRAAIDNMLQNASRLMEQSADLGIDLSEPDIQTKSDKPTENSEESSPELSSNQMAAMNGGVINLSSGTASAKESQPNASVPLGADMMPAVSAVPDASPKEEPKKKMPVTLFDVDEDGNPIIPQANNKKKKKLTLPKLSKGLAAGIAVVALSLGLLGGFFAKSYLFPDFVSPDCQAFAEKSVKAVNKALGTDNKLYIAEAYVKSFVSSRQCIFRAFSGEGDTAASKWYRVKENDGDGQPIYVYLEIDPLRYEQLKNSPDNDDKLEASRLMNIQNETNLCVKEAKSGDWETANSILLNNILNPYIPPEPKTEAETQTVQTSVTETSDTSISESAFESYSESPPEGFGK